MRTPLQTPLVFFLDSEIGRGTAKIVHALQMSDAYARRLGDAILCLPFGAATPDEAGAIAARELGRPPAFRLMHLPMRAPRGRFKMPAAAWAMRRILPTIQADRHVTLSPLMLDLLTHARRPTLYEAHAAYLSRQPLLDRWLTGALLRHVRRPATRVFAAISEALRAAWVARGVPAAKTVTAHDGVDASWLTEPEGVAAARERLGGRPDRRLVLYTGSLGADRDVDRVLRLARDFPAADFAIIGWPRPQLNDLRARAAAEGLANTRMLDRVPHAAVRAHLAAADVLLMIWSSQVPTIRYCSPMKLFEYLAAGRIIVGDGFPTIREVLRHGEHAWLAEPDRYADLRAQMAAALAAPVDDPMRARARALAREYTWDRRAGRLLEAFDAR